MRSSRSQRVQRAPTPLPRNRKTDDQPDRAVSLRWDLTELPSSQHKAGLAGLALCVRFLARKVTRTGVCRIEQIDESGLTLRIDRKGMQALFDDIYAASLEEQEREKKLVKKAAGGSSTEIAPKRTVQRLVKDKKGADQRRTFFVYDQVVPCGELIAEWDPAGAAERKLWLKLWRDVVWSTLRGVPATREPYNARAEGRQVSDGAEAWDSLVENPGQSVELPSTYYLGAQARSAENVLFRDRSRFRFLLHFWPFVAPMYVPAILSRDGTRDFEGFVIAVPDVADLEEFVANWEQVARERGVEASGYRPRDAVVDIAAEAALDVARRTFAVVSRLQGAAATRPWLTAVDVFHIERDRNNVRVRSLSRLELHLDRADAYGRARREYWSPIFRRRRIVSILDGNQPWWTGFGELCAISPEALTISDSSFRHDCRIAFTEVEMKDTSRQGEKTIEELIYQIARQYVTQRVATKYQLEWKDAKGHEAAERAYNEKKAKVAREAFLAVRSRTGMDFVHYFTGTLCAVSQRLNEPSFLQIARALHDEAELERLRSLTLLALSAVA